MSYAQRGMRAGARSGVEAAQQGFAGTPGKRSLTEDLAPSQPVTAASAREAIMDRELEGATTSSEVAHAAPEPGVGETPMPGPRTPGAITDAPRATYLVPFDRAPLAAPGERIICSAEFTGGTASDYEMVYTGVGGHFTTATGPMTVTIQA
jgi:hypothetical protein